MAASGAPPAPARQPRRGPAPIASFDHDGSDESSPESKQTFRLPEIREDPASRAASASSGTDLLAPAEQRARSHSTPAAGALVAPPAPRIDISRASSSSHHDSRDSSPELALFAGGGASSEDRARLELGFREDGALDLRSSTEELAFLEPAPGEQPAPPPPPARPTTAAPPPPPLAAERRHSRKDSQSSEVALLGVSGRTSRLSSVGSQCSAQSALSALSRVSRLSVVSGTSRSPSPHRMLLETSFCGPKPIETDPEISAGALVEQILGIVEGVDPKSAASPTSPPAPLPAPIDARDRREVRTEVTVESARIAPAPVTPAVTIAAPPPPEAPPSALVDIETKEKETANRTRTGEERKARPRVRREPSEPEVYKSSNKSKDVIIIKLRPDDGYEEEDGSSAAAGAGVGAGEAARKPATLELAHAARPAEPAPPSPAPSRRRSPSPAGGGGPPVSRKSSFCSLFKSRETIASPESPSEALRRKRSLTEGRSRSKSRDRSATPTSATKIRGSVLSLFRTPRRSVTTAGASPSPGSREGSPVVHTARSLGGAPAPSVALSDRRRADKLKYYEDTKDGIIHIPLRTPPDERGGGSSGGGASTVRRSSGAESAPAPVPEPAAPRPASAPQPRALPDQPTFLPEPHLPPKQDRHSRAQTDSQPRPQPEPPTRAKTELQIRSIPDTRSATRTPPKPIHRTVLPDGSIIIPLHSPTERVTDTEFPDATRADEPTPISETKRIEETKAISDRNHTEISIVTTMTTPAPTEWEVTGAPDTPPRERREAHYPPTPATPATPETPARAEPPQPEDSRRKRKERLVFTTHVGSREQVFSTQFSITKTPSVTSEISGSFPSFAEADDGRAPPLRDTHITAEQAPATATARADPGEVSGGATPQDAPRDSSESEPSSEAAPSCVGNDVEKRGLVVQESFEEELPYVPTTLPQERSVALPMVPVRERGGVRVSGVQRPRAAAPVPTPARAPAPPPAPMPPPADKLRIKLPRRPRTASVSSAPRPERPRTRSGTDDVGGESRSKSEWIDFEEVPERRKQPKRIQTLPAGAVSAVSEAAAGAGAGGVMFSYVEPEHCRCECHGHARADDQLPLLRDEMQTSQTSQTSRISSSSAEIGSESHSVELSVHIARPFTADLGVHAAAHGHAHSARDTFSP